jgi:hypothetical protein
VAVDRSDTRSAAQPQYEDSLENRIDLMRWSEHLDEAREGSLTDVWWNRDVPALLAVVRAAEEVLDHFGGLLMECFRAEREGANDAAK